MGYPTIYLEIDELTVKLGRLSRKGDFICCSLLEEIVLPTLTVEDGVIYNISVLSDILKHFLNFYKFTDTYVLLAAPYLASLSGVKKDLALFQITLCVCKSGFFVGKLFDKRIL